MLPQTGLVTAGEAELEVDENAVAKIGLATSTSRRVNGIKPLPGRFIEHAAVRSAPFHLRKAAQAALEVLPLFFRNSNKSALIRSG